MGDFLLSLITKMVDFIRSFFYDGLNFVLDGIKSFFTSIGDLIYDIAIWFMDSINYLFGDLFEALDGLAYFSLESFSVIVLALQVILKVASFPFAFIASLIGLFTSFLTWNGATVPYNSDYSQGFTQAFIFFSDIGLDVVAGVFTVIIWITFVMAILRVARRG